MFNELLKNKVILLALFIFFTLSIWFLASFIILLFANRLIFKNKNSQGKVTSNLPFEEVFLPYGNERKIYLVQSFAKKSDHLVVLFFHGNAGNLSRPIDVLSPFYNVVAPAYPGYHLSTGKPTEQGIYETVDLTMKYLKEIGIKEENILIFGASLGGAAALYTASKYPKVKRVIIVNSFDRIKSICQENYSPFCIFSGSILNNIKLGQEVKSAKIRQFHSIEDEVVNFKLGENLFRKIASSDKKFYQIKGKHADFDAVEIIKESLI